MRCASINLFSVRKYSAQKFRYARQVSLSEERRRDLIKVTKAEAENSRIAIRNIRRDAIHSLKELEKKKEISEDDERKAEDQVQKATDVRIKQIDEVLAEKEREMLEI